MLESERDVFTKSFHAQHLIPLTTFSFCKTHQSLATPFESSFLAAAFHTFALRAIIRNYSNPLSKKTAVLLEVIHGEKMSKQLRTLSSRLFFSEKKTERQNSIYVCDQSYPQQSSRLPSFSALSRRKAPSG
jgi:plasmid maintenance system killer protein